MIVIYKYFHSYVHEISSNIIVVFLNHYLEIMKHNKFKSLHSNYFHHKHNLVSNEDMYISNDILFNQVWLGAAVLLFRENVFVSLFYC